jgi:hypothetical protein
MKIFRRDSIVGDTRDTLSVGLDGVLAECIGRYIWGVVNLQVRVDGATRLVDARVRPAARDTDFDDISAVYLGVFKMVDG